MVVILAPRLSLIIPAYNEEKRIAITLDRIEVYLSRQDYGAEIIVVDDGSLDTTAELVKALYPKVNVISYTPNRGKGHAVKTGMLAATGDYRVFYDADGSTPIDELDRMWPCFEAGADIVIGSRSLPESDVQVRQHYIRESMGRTFNKFVKMILGLPFVDTQCGFKGFTARSSQILFPRQRRNRFSFDAELLYIARKHHLRVHELPVCWINSPHSRVKLLRDSFDMLRGIFRIRLNDLARKYE
jgi:dolichyl-phosphate beta-glucosyltransferase